MIPRMFYYTGLTTVGLVGGWAHGANQPGYTLIAVVVYLIIIGLLAVRDGKEISC